MTHHLIDFQDIKRQTKINFSIMKGVRKITCRTLFSCLQIHRNLADDRHEVKGMFSSIQLVNEERVHKITCRAFCILNFRLTKYVSMFFIFI